jgi:hypothetical protein
MVLDIQTVHHILKNTAVQNVNKPFVYITDLTSTLRIIWIFFGTEAVYTSKLKNTEVMTMYHMNVFWTLYAWNVLGFSIH